MHAKAGIHALGIVAALMAAPAAAEHHVRTHLGGNLGAGYDDNVGNAAEDFDVLDSSFVAGAANLDHTRRLSLNTALLLRGALQAEYYEQFDGLSNGRLLAMARLSHRPAGGFYMPTLAGWLSAAALEFNSALRDGFEYRGGMFVSEPLTTAIAARLGVAAAERMSDGEVFDLSTWSASVDLDWSIAPRLTLYGGYQFQDGDIVSTSTVPVKSCHPNCAGSGVLVDDAIEDLPIYRVEATTHLATLGFNVPLSPKLAVDGQLRRIDSETDGGTGYERWQSSISALLRW
jgi:hypothetical protein